MSAAAVANEEGMEAATPTRERRGEETSDVEEGTERVRWSTATEESSCSNEKAGTNGRTKGGEQESWGKEKDANYCPKSPQYVLIALESERI